MKRLRAQIERTQKKLNQLRERERREKMRQSKPARTAKKRGRPRISEDLLIKAVKMAETKSLSDIALQLGIAESTLFNYGITKIALHSKPRC